MNDPTYMYEDTLAALISMGFTERDARALLNELIEAHTAPLKEQIASMQKDVDTLARLRGAGVDNWEGYSLAFDDPDEEDE